MTVAPRIDTDRLTLRAPGPQDLTPFATFFASEENTRYLGGTRTADETWRYLCEVIGHWSMRGFGRWMVCPKGSDTPIGLVGLHEPRDWPETEVGWYIWDGNGQGYATEAARAARDWAYHSLGLTTLVSIIAPGNDASVRVAERMGATRDPDLNHARHGTVMVYRHPGPETLT